MPFSGKFLLWIHGLLVSEWSGIGLGLGFCFFSFFLSFFFNLLITIIQSNHDQNLEEMKNLNCTFHIRHNDFPEINAFESQLLASAFGWIQWWRDFHFCIFFWGGGVGVWLPRKRRKRQENKKSILWYLKLTYWFPFSIQSLLATGFVYCGFYVRWVFLLLYLTSCANAILCDIVLFFHFYILFGLLVEWGKGEGNVEDSSRKIIIFKYLLGFYFHFPMLFPRPKWKISLMKFNLCMHCGSYFKWIP